MRSVVYAFIGTCLYAITGVVIEQKLEKFNTTALVFLFIAPMVPLALIWLGVQKITHQEINFPTGTALLIVMAMGVAYFFADYFYLGSFSHGGSVITISTIILIVPAVAALIRYLWVGGLPNAYQVIGYLLIVIAMVFITKGSH